MIIRYILASSIPVVFVAALSSPVALATDSESARQEVAQALQRTPNVENGKRAYKVCAVCHLPEGWGGEDGYYPQIAGQIHQVTIKQLADIRARNRDTPTMFPFATLYILSVQDIADVAAYLEQLPMSPHNGLGPGTDLEHGKRLYKKYCAECHGEKGEGYAKEKMPLIQGQHYRYLVRQFEWIGDGKRRNADQEMVEQIQGFSKRDVSAIMDYVSRLRPPLQKLASPGWRNPDFPKFVRDPGFSMGRVSQM
jgi:cytochrome c553